MCSCAVPVANECSLLVVPNALLRRDSTESWLLASPSGGSPAREGVGVGRRVASFFTRSSKRCFAALSLNSCKVGALGCCMLLRCLTRDCTTQRVGGARLLRRHSLVDQRAPTYCERLEPSVHLSLQTHAEACPKFGFRSCSKRDARLGAACATRLFCPDKTVSSSLRVMS